MTCEVKHMHRTTKIWARTLKKLKILAAVMGVSMSQLVEDLVEEKAKKLGVIFPAEE
jgi:hypothetical protein